MKRLSKPEDFVDVYNAIPPPNAQVAAFVAGYPAAKTQEEREAYAKQGFLDVNKVQEQEALVARAFRTFHREVLADLRDMLEEFRTRKDFDGLVARIKARSRALRTREGD